MPGWAPAAPPLTLPSGPRRKADFSTSCCGSSASPAAPWTPTAPTDPASSTPGTGELIRRCHFFWPRSNLKVDGCQSPKPEGVREVLPGRLLGGRGALDREPSALRLPGLPSGGGRSVVDVEPVAAGRAVRVRSREDQLSPGGTVRAARAAARRGESGAERSAAPAGGAAGPPGAPAAGPGG